MIYIGQNHSDLTNKEIKDGPPYCRYSLTHAGAWAMTAEQLAGFLASQAVTSCTSAERLRKAGSRAVGMEEQQEFQLGRNQLKELGEQVADDLPPQAFSIQSITRT
jgi:DNA recombination-dependent growth factor C